VGSQLSRPYQIALVAAVALLAVWFFALRPKGEESSSPPTPSPPTASSKPQTPFGRAVEHARGAGAASDAANQRLQSATGDKAQTPARPAPAAASPAPNAQRPTPNAPTARATPAPRVLVLLFWNAGAADDRAVRAALSHVDRHRGRVAVAAAPIAHVGRYKPITSGVHVLESPTVIVLDTRTRRARTIAGYADVRELDHLVAQTLGA
jgi:hypothetical protein